MRVRQRGLLQGLLALVVAAACGSDSSVGTISATPSPTALASYTPAPQTTPTPSPTPPAVLDDHFGFLVQKFYANSPIPGPIGLTVRPESNPLPLFALHSGTAGGIKVSPEGRRIAYWSGKELRVLDTDLYFFQASGDAKEVFGRNLAPNKGPFLGTTLLRVWQVGSYASGVELKAPPGQIIRAAEWRPGTSEIGVLFDDHLEFWKSSGERRSVALPSMPPLPATNPNATLLFRADGKAVLIGRQVDTSATNTYVLAVDIASGQTAVVDWPGGLPEPGTSVRLGPPQ